MTHDYVGQEAVAARVCSVPRVDDVITSTHRDHGVDVIAVHVAVGDRVEPGSVLIEVESEKATFEVDAGHAGTVREVLVREGEEPASGTWS